MSRLFPLDPCFPLKTNMSMMLRRVVARKHLLSSSQTCVLNHGSFGRHFSITESFVNINTSIATSSIVSSTKLNMIHLHEWLHVPWFVEIGLVTIVARFLVTLPLMISQRRILSRYEALKPEIMTIAANLQHKVREQAYLHSLNNEQRQALFTKTLTKEINRLIVRDNCHPVKSSMVVFFQVPMWIVLSHSYRALSQLYPDPSDPAAITAYQQLSTEGCLWFSNLTLPDPTGMLPLSTAIINLVIIQLYVNDRRKKNIVDSKFIKVITNASRAFSLIILPIGLVMPSSMSFYWFMSSSVGLLHNYLLLRPDVRRLLRLEPNAKS